MPLITQFKCSECGFASQDFWDFNSENCEKITDIKKSYIERNRITQCPKCEAIL